MSGNGRDIEIRRGLVKDLQIVENEPQRLAEWVRIARAAVEGAS